MEPESGGPAARNVTRASFRRGGDGRAPCLRDVFHSASTFR